ncbi:hypothetical protein M406DRAFT_67232 [Cryphonectria parasitica EP155]|uniref:Chitinase n=1 Tax=Cryphonectria parasitica (strain ATCC 38755 / EP155) TaxID=660469 RepID=A0A9P5CV59_CRYP1|nr:uncharacterized protein M406DRAFT_67232 [Cryphonectria parasitica EP155]KAF3770871.1 hypothetical protein M406DRAFT_67232 [Cryphonectria parasitica EP155]
MLFRNSLWGVCLLSVSASALRFEIPYSLLLARNNVTTGAVADTSDSAQDDASTATNSSTTVNGTVPADIPNLCALGPPGSDSVSEVSGPTASGCSDCITASGVIIGTSVPTTLVPDDSTASGAAASGSAASGSAAGTGSAVDKRAELAHVPRATLLSRAPEAQPLAEPNPGGQEDFMETIRSSDSTQAIGIVPSKDQLKNWSITLQIDGKNVQTPIGVTGVWTPWPKEPTNFKMVGMHGCTGVLIVVWFQSSLPLTPPPSLPRVFAEPGQGNSGFWAGHWWESALPTNINGGSSFNYRYGSGDNDVVTRPLADFKKIAADILKAPAPAGADSFYGDPFGASNGGGDIYILSKAAGSSAAQQKKLMYTDQIQQLQLAMQKYVRRNTVTIRPYIGAEDAFTDNGSGEKRSPAGVPDWLNGVSILQYSPYAGTSSKGCPEARARVWEEINTSPAVDRSWPASVGGSSKRDAACALSSSSSSSSSLTSAAATASQPPCYPYADPDNGVQDSCMCTNGVMVSAVTATSSGAEDLCPWTTLPPQALTTAKPTKNTLQYQFTYTDLSSKVIECETFSTQDYAGYPASFSLGAGSSAVLYEPPVASMELGSSKVNVASMTGETLYTSVSNAVMSLCPTPTSEGAWTSCETGTVTVGKADFLEKGEPQEGDVTLHLTDTQYNSSDFLNLFVNMLARGANASASGSNCDLQTWDYTTESIARRDIAGRVDVPLSVPSQHKGNGTFCNINSFFDTQFYDGVQETAKMWFEAEFGFELGEMGNFDCSSTVDLVGDVLSAIFDAIFPEFAWLITSGIQLGELACEAAETFNPTKSRREIEADRASAKLARAWEKEMKKDRKLPMPDHRKRELGLMD